jgi:hypothetical protein
MLPDAFRRMGIHTLDFMWPSTPMTSSCPLRIPQEHRDIGEDDSGKNGYGIIGLANFFWPC